MFKSKKANIKRITKVQNENISSQSYEINLYRRTIMGTDEIESNAKYRKDKQFQNLTIFQNLRNFTNLLIFKFDN